MAKFNITANVDMYVDVVIEADSEYEAKKIFDEKISVSANLVDLPEDKFNVEHDYIDEITNLEVYSAD